jgi:hypothetical protein
MNNPENINGSHNSGLSENLLSMIESLFKHWQLTLEEQNKLLYPSAKYSIRNRVQLLLAIHKYLRMLFPYDTKFAYEWIKAPNRHFSEKAPIQVILKEEFSGLMKINDYLKECLLMKSKTDQLSSNKE